MRRLLGFPFRLLRLLFLSVLLAVGQIWANKLRSVLTTSGIVIGVASVTSVIAALSGLRGNVLAEFEALGTNKMFIFPDFPEDAPPGRFNWGTVRFWPDEFDGLGEACPSIESFTRIGSYTQTVKAEGRRLDGVEIVGIEPAWHAIEKRTVTLGRPFSMIDEQQARPTCLIDDELRDTLRLRKDCVGEALLIGNRSFRIVGLVEKGNDSSRFGGQGEQLQVFIPFATAWKLQKPFFHVIATSVSPELSADARAEVRFFLRRSRQLSYEDPDTFNVQVIEEFLQRFNAIALTITMVAGGIVGISLLVGGVGIMNIMLVSVSERTREIGLRKAVGARPAAILLQFLVESIMLCFVGGLIGVLCGQMLTWMVANIPGAELERAAIPFWAVVMAFGFAASVGVVFGMFPAIKAARLDPIVALRHE